MKTACTQSWGPHAYLLSIHMFFSVFILRRPGPLWLPTMSEEWTYLVFLCIDFPMWKLSWLYLHNSFLLASWINAPFNWFHFNWSISILFYKNCCFDNTINTDFTRTDFFHLIFSHFCKNGPGWNQVSNHSWCRYDIFSWYYDCFHCCLWFFFYQWYIRMLEISVFTVECLNNNNIYFDNLETFFLTIRYYLNSKNMCNSSYVWIWDCKKQNHKHETVMLYQHFSIFDWLIFLFDFQYTIIVIITILQLAQFHTDKTQGTRTI